MQHGRAGFLCPARHLHQACAELLSVRFDRHGQFPLKRNRGERLAGPIVQDRKDSGSVSFSSRRRSGRYKWDCMSVKKRY
jgi:hypothetical protein